MPAGAGRGQRDDLGVGVAQTRALGPAAHDERGERPHAVRVGGAGREVAGTPRAAQTEHVHGARGERGEVPAAVALPQVAGRGM